MELMSGIIASKDANVEFRKVFVSGMSHERDCLS